MDKLLVEFKEKARSRIDWALYSLLIRFKDELPKLDYYFHKAFRQCDCVDVENGGHMDVAIYNLLCESTLFWELFEKYKSA